MKMRVLCVLRGEEQFFIGGLDHKSDPFTLRLLNLLVSNH